MPNHYTTKVTVLGPQADIDTFRAKHFNKDAEGTLGLDFNTVIPMPEVIKGTESSSTVDTGLLLLGRDDILNSNRRGFGLDDRGVADMLNWPWVKEAGVTDVAGLKKLLLERKPDCLEKAQRAIDAYEQTGFISWYDWSIENWGTKWNSYELHMVRSGSGTLCFSFQTAWAPPLPVLNRLRQMYPKLTFQVKGRDEFEDEWSLVA
jgi:hypothetical protein